MNIGIYSPGWPPGAVPNGIVTYYGNLVPALRSLGHEVYIVAGKSTDDCKDPYVTEIRTEKSAGRRLDSHLWKLRDFLSPEYSSYRGGGSAIAGAFQRLSGEADIDIFQMEESFGWSRIVSSSLRQPLVVRLHGPWFLTGKWGGVSQGKSFSYRVAREGEGFTNAFAVTAPSAAVLNAAVEQYQHTPALAQVIPNCIGVDDAYRVWDLSTCNPNELLFVGRFEELKGGDLVIGAFARAASTRPELVLTFVGPDRGITLSNGIKIDGPEFVKRFLPTEVGNRINFLGQLSPAEILSLRQRAFLTIVASRYETFANTVLEAFACGSPIVGTEVGGIVEIIQHGRNGLLAKPGSVQSIASCVETLLDNPTLAAEMGRQARYDCRTRYSPEKLAGETADFYEQVVRRYLDRR